MAENEATQEDASQRTSYFDRIPIWSDDGKRFEILSDAISGRIPVTRVESWREWTALLENPFFNRLGVQLAYRGHRRYDWSLSPTLGRLATSGIVSKELGERQLLFFRRAVRGRLLDRSLVDEGEEDELWSVGQHHGLMTPLLDWTYSPYVALFFAFAKDDRLGEEDNPYRSIYVINKTFVDDAKLCPDIRVLEPRKDDHGRLVNQAGLFTFSPYDATIENKLADILGAEDFGDSRLREADEDEQAEVLAEYICKIYIKNEEREACLRHLRRMNVHPASLFPDLLGASDYCNILIHEAELQRAEREKVQQAQDEKVKAAEPRAEAREQPEPITIQDPLGISEILQTPEEAAQVEPGRISLIADELKAELGRNMVVDWRDRDPALARLRNRARVILRRYGYPQTAREDVVTKILEALIRSAI